MADFDKGRLGDYVDVAARIAEFRTKYPEGSLQPADPALPYRIETIADRTFIVVIAAAYRTPDDSRPGIGMAYEPWPGRTPYTKDSELMNAETSAWGRAIVAVLAADTKRGIASQEEVRNRQAEREHKPEWDANEQEDLRLAYEAELEAAKTDDQVTEISLRIGAAKKSGTLSPGTYNRLVGRGAKRRAELEVGRQQAARSLLPVEATP